VVLVDGKVLYQEVILSAAKNLSAKRDSWRAASGGEYNSE